jgi:hypothetical protein
LNPGYCAALAALVVAGCAGSSGTGMEVSDRGVVVPSARASIDIGSSRVAAPSDPHSGHAIELGYAHAKGSSTQTLGAGQQPVFVGGQTFSAPQQLNNDASVGFFDIAYRWRRFVDSGAFGIEILGGGTYTSMHYTATSPAQRSSDGLHGWGANAGLGGILRLRPGTSLQARGTWFGTTEVWGNTNARRFEINFVQALGPNASVRAGFASWDVHSDRNAGSKINATLSGPAIGIDLHF